ncbi:MAG: hypothetical protein HKO81_05770 [Flavobacteriaceae bacterium]|nr:hypothetical protein [Flavobacteriaceae bacterium]
MTNNINSDISLKDLFTRINEYFSYLLKSWKKIVASGIIGGLILFLFNFRNPPNHLAELTFMLNEDAALSLGGIGNILGQFGFASPVGESNYDKIMELSKTRRIAQNALFRSVDLNNKSDFLANHLINNFEENNDWQKKSFVPFFSREDSLNLQNFRFSHDSIQNFNTLENKALKRLHYLLTGDDKSTGLFESDFSELTGIMTLAMNSSSEDLSINTVSLMFDELSRYYIEKSTEKQEYEFNIIKNKYDSIYNRLSEVQFQLAEFQDNYKGLFRKQDVLREKTLKTEEQKLLLMSGEVEKQLQLASLAVDNKTPYVQLIDKPLKPIKPNNKSALYFFLLGGFLGGLLMALFLIFRKMYREIMFNE